MKKGIGIGLSIGVGGRDLQTPTMKINPPVANTLEELAQNSRLRATRRISQDSIGVIRAYLSGEDSQKKYTDREIILYMKSKGYNLTRSDVRFVRSVL